MRAIGLSNETPFGVAEFVRVARLSDIPPGTIKGVKAKGKEILVANVDGEAYAVSDRCSHLRYRLHNGAKLDGTVIECHGHGAKYDVTDGGNWEGHNILNRLSNPVLGLPAAEKALRGMRTKLLARRTTRVRPGWDDKVLADWNGLMIAALAHAAKLMDRPEWLTAEKRVGCGA